MFQWSIIKFQINNKNINLNIKNYQKSTILNLYIPVKNCYF